MGVLELIGIAFVAAFVLYIFGFLIFVNYQLAKLTEVLNSIPREMRKVSDSRGLASREQRN